MRPIHLAIHQAAVPPHQHVLIWDGRRRRDDRFGRGLVQQAGSGGKRSQIQELRHARRDSLRNKDCLLAVSHKLTQNRCLILTHYETFKTMFRTAFGTLTATGTQLGYARVSTGHQSLDQQIDALTAAGVDATRVYSDKLSGTSTREQRPGLASLMDYAREGDAIVVVGIDRLGRNAAEVMTTIRELGERGIVLRSLREGIDTSNATGRMVAGVLASLAELELELGRERRAAARDARKARGQSIGRPKALDKSKAALAQRMHASGESASTIAATLGVSRATVYRVLSESDALTE